MFKGLTPEERKAALKAMKEKTKEQMEQEQIEHEQFMSNINRKLADLKQRNQALEDFNDKIIGKDAKTRKRRCEIM